MTRYQLRINQQFYLYNDSDKKYYMNLINGNGFWREDSDPETIHTIIMEYYE